MTHRERMLAAIRGQPCDQIAWAPRLDLWYRANQRAGTLPARYRQASLAQLAASLDMGMHAVIPDFRDLRNAEDDVDRALGIYNLWNMPCRSVLRNVRWDAVRKGDQTVVTYSTPYGSLQTVTTYDEAMRKAGVSITHVSEPLIKSVSDFKAAGYVYENIEVLPNYDGFSEFETRIGESGLAVGFISLSASPLHVIQRELMPMDQFCYELHDHPDELSALAHQIEAYWQRLWTVAVASPATVLLVGANYDATVTYPPLFAEHFLPWLKRYADELHRRGKYLLTHTDGENTGLLSHYLAAGIDIADSICPAPMTRLSFREVRNAFNGRITIMGGIPSIALLKASFYDRQFDEFLDSFFSQAGAGDHLILGISDTTPPNADFERLIKIGRRVAAFGPVNPPAVSSHCDTSTPLKTPHSKEQV